MIGEGNFVLNTTEANRLEATVGEMAFVHVDEEGRLATIPVNEKTTRIRRHVNGQATA